MVDLHNHLMPGVDDGAVDLDQARSGLAAMAADGITAIVCTPHIDASLTRDPERLERRLSELDVAWEALLGVARREQPGVELERGAELRLDTPHPDLSDPRLRLAGGRYALVEFHGMSIPPGASGTFRSLVEDGVTPVIAHPERYADVLRNGPELQAWRESGALLQGNCGSLLGRYGEAAQEALLRLLEHGWIDYMASDFHARGRPHNGRARERLAGLAADGLAELLLEENPRRVLRGLDTLAVPPLDIPRPRRADLLGRSS